MRPPWDKTLTTDDVLKSINTVTSLIHVIHHENRPDYTYIDGLRHVRKTLAKMLELKTGED